MSNKIALKRGVTLTEVLFSAAILSLVIVSVLVIFVQTVDMSQRVDYEYAATNLAKNRIERAMAVLESSGFDFLTDLAEIDSLVDSNGVSNPNGGFRRTTVVTTNYLGKPRLTKVDVSAVYKYRGVWRTTSPINMNMVFTNIK